MIYLKKNGVNPICLQLGMIFFFLIWIRKDGKKMLGEEKSTGKKREKKGK